MHAQARSKPAKSPADLAAFLQVLANAGINIQSAGGSDLELGGEFAFGLEHDDGDDGPYDTAILALAKAGYSVRLVDSGDDDRLQVYSVPNQPGKLFECVQDATDKNGTVRAIKDIAIGTPDIDNQIRVQIYSEDVP